MIYTCTLNPSVDYVVWLEKFITGDVSRSKTESFDPGGKGINVSLLLNNLKIDSTLLGFMGGFTGHYLMDLLDENKYLHLDFIKVKGTTRVNVIIQETVESRISANGPIITDHDYEKLIHKVNNIDENDIFILSGSIPSSIKKDVYSEIAEIVKNKKALFIADTTGEKLLNILQYHPFLIKPNRKEVENIFNVELNNEKDIIKYGKLLREKGAQNVLISLSGDGAILITNDKIYRSNALTDKVVNTVGAGDSMIAGFVAMYLKTKSYPEALRFGAASGSATAFSIGLGKEDVINALFNRIEVKEIVE